MEKGNHFTTASTSLLAAGAIFATKAPSFLQENLPTTIDKVLFCATYLASTALPDVDQKIRGLKHRTLTHSVWFLGLLFLPGLLYKPLLGPFFASLHHILIDYFSAQGIALFWPLEGYLRQRDGRAIKKGYHPKLYRSRQASESIVATIICLMNVGITALFLNNNHTIRTIFQKWI